MFEAKCPHCGSPYLNLYGTEIVTLEETGAIIIREGICQECYSKSGSKRKLCHCRQRKLFKIKISKKY